MTLKPVRFLITGLLIAAFLASAASAFAVIVHDAGVKAGDTVSIPVEIDEVPVNFWFYQITLTSSDPTLGEFVSVAYPPWVTITDSSALPGDTLTMKAGNFVSPIAAGTLNVSLGEFTLRGDAAGSGQIIVTVDSMETDGGVLISPATINGNLVVEILTGSIAVTSVPEGAEIFLDGNDQSLATPNTLTGVPVGDHVVKVTKDDYKPAEMTIKVLPDDTVSADFTLEILTGSIAVTSVPDGAEIFLDGNDQSLATPNTLTGVPVGDHVVKVTKDDYKPAEMTIKVLPDDTVPADFTLEPIATTGFIHVTSTPSGAEIFIDGMDTGMVTEATIDAMPPGDYLVKVTLDDYQDAEQIVTVAAGETVDVDFQLVEAPLPPKAQFLAFPRQGTAPLTVLFIDLSQGDPTSRLWDFGDGTTSTEPFPLHTYGAAGKYTVTLTVTNGGGSDTVKRENYITVKAANPPKAQFLAYPRQGTAPMTVLFLDLSLGSPTSRLWDFGDGTKSTEPFPLHTYSAPGKYTVTLTVTNGGGSDTLVRHNFIIVRAANPPRAQFTAYPQDGEAPLAVTFLDLSWGYPTSRVWDFGDGTGSTEINPVHVYEKPGKYTVTLTVTNDAGSDTAIHKNFIKVSEKKHRMKGTGESEEGSGDTGLPQVPVSTPVPVTTQRPQIKIG